MATVKDIYNIVDEFAPFSMQMNFDNAGLLVGSEDAPVERVLLSLDITLPVIKEAEQVGAQLILAHHPVIFHPVKALLAGDPTADKLIALVRKGIAALCAHTNLDVAVGGVNDALAEKIGLKNVEIFQPDGVDAVGRPYGLGRIGVLEDSFTLIEFAEKVKNSLGSNGLRYVDVGRKVHRVAVGGGSCGSELYDAFRKGCDTFVTADLKYDHFLDAKALGLNLIDAGHFPTENVVLPVLERLLRERCPEVEVLTSQSHRKEVFSYL